MKTIKVVDILSTPVFLSPDKGVKVREIIERALGIITPGVTIDFAGYEFISSTFLNHAFGQLCIDHEWSTQDFESKVHVINLHEDDVDELQLALDNAQSRRELSKNGINPEQFFAAHLPA